MTSAAAVEHFMDRCEPEPNSGCWIWLGGAYARTRYGNCRILPGYVLAHRTAYRLFVGEPGASMVLHRCDVRRCVNPAHLYLGDHRQNMIDMKARDRADDRRGERNTAAFLTARLVDGIRLMKTDGWTPTEIALELGLKRTHVAAIVYRRIWTHV